MKDIQINVDSLSQLLDYIEINWNEAKDENKDEILKRVNKFKRFANKAEKDKKNEENLHME